MSSARDGLIPQITAEFSQVFAFSRSRWAGFAEDIHPELRGVGLFVLQIIHRKGPITATEIAHLLMLDKSVVSRQVTKLRQIDLVDAVASEEDRRVVLLTTTEQTRESLERVQALNADAYLDRFADWSDEDLAQLHDLLHRFNTSASADPVALASGAAARCSRHASEQAHEGTNPGSA